MLKFEPGDITFNEEISMPEGICLLITLFGKMSESLYRVALQATPDQLPGDIIECPLEPMNKAVLHGLLPEYIQDFGVIVEVEEILHIEVHHPTVNVQ